MNDRLDIAWSDAWRSLIQMVGPIKGGRGKGEYLLPDHMINFGRLLYGERGTMRIGKRVVWMHDPTLHPCSDLHDREKALWYIQYVGIFIEECERLIEEELERINNTAPANRQNHKPNTQAA